MSVGRRFCCCRARIASGRAFGAGGLELDRSLLATSAIRSGLSFEFDLNEFVVKVKEGRWRKEDEGWKEDEIRK